MIDKVFPKIHNEGYKFLVIFSFTTLILYFVSSFLGLVGLVITVWVYYFFRDPDRVSIDDDNYLTSPADGLVLQVLETDGPKELELENKKFTKISIFMNVFDCHVNRTPCAGKFHKLFTNLENFLMLLLIKQVKKMKEIIIKFKIVLEKILL